MSIQLQRAHLPPVFVPYYESSAMSHTNNPKDQKMFSMNFNFINTINLYWLQLYSIFVFYSKMLINQSVINSWFSPLGDSNATQGPMFIGGPRLEIFQPLWRAGFLNQKWMKNALMYWLLVKGGFSPRAIIFSRNQLILKI